MSSSVKPDSTTSFSRRAVIGVLCGMLVAAAGPGAAQTAAWPSRPFRVVVPYPASGIVDLMARAVGEGLAAKLGQPVVVEPKPGANASIGTELVAKAEPDGHTILLATLALGLNPHLNKVPWHPVNDFAGVAHVGVVANIAAAHPSLGVTDLKSLVTLLKSRPGQVNYVNPGIGSSPHVSTELLQQNTGTRLASINYKGIPPAIPDFLSGRVPFGFFPHATIAPHIRVGKAVPLAVAAPVRDRQFPDIPTMAEQGYAVAQVNSWYAFAVPKKTPQTIIDRLNKEINAVLADPATVARVESIGGTVVAGWTPPQVDQLIADEYVRWEKFARDTSIEAK